MPDECLVQSGREFQPEEIEVICTTVALLPGLARRELATTLCEHLEWMTASGSPKVTACLKLLERLEAQGRLRLKAKRSYRQVPREQTRQYGERTDPPPRPRTGRLCDLGKVSLEVVSGRERTGIWNEYVDRYHYLGYRRPFGCRLRYFVVAEQDLLGCVLLAGAAKAVERRDRWIGWSAQERQRHLPWVANNTRFLIFPWVQIPHLASHVLGQLSRRVREDWFERWGYRPVLLETFVDRQRYQGTCYRAAGWIDLGETSGRGLPRPGRTYTSTPKRILVRPLVKDFRAQLCTGSFGQEVSR
jgi:hypothetical protein